MSITTTILESQPFYYTFPFAAVVKGTTMLNLELN